MPPCGVPELLAANSALNDPPRLRHFDYRQTSFSHSLHQFRPAPDDGDPDRAEVPHHCFGRAALFAFGDG